MDEELTKVNLLEGELVVVERSSKVSTIIRFLEAGVGSRGVP